MYFNMNMEPSVKDVFVFLTVKYVLTALGIFITTQQLSSPYFN